MVKFNEDFEENIRKVVPLASKEIESEMYSDLVNLANGKVLKDMASQEETKAKTLVREKQNGPRVINNNQRSDKPSSQQANLSDKYRYVSNGESAFPEDQNNPFDSLRNNGNTSICNI